MISRKKHKHIDEKDAEVEELKKANAVLEEKITSLLDVLYSCKDCGWHGDYCEWKLNEPDNLIEAKNDVQWDHSSPGKWCTQSL